MLYHLSSMNRCSTNRLPNGCLLFTWHYCSLYVCVCVCVCTIIFDQTYPLQHNSVINRSFDRSIIVSNTCLLNRTIPIISTHEDRGHNWRIRLHVHLTSLVTDQITNRLAIAKPTYINCLFFFLSFSLFHSLFPSLVLRLSNPEYIVDSMELQLFGSMHHAL